MWNIKRWIVRRVRLKMFSIYLFFTLTIYFFLCLNQIELKETSLPWKYQQQPQALQYKQSDDKKTSDELFYFTSDQYMDKKLSTIRQKIEKHLLQMETKLVKKGRNDNSTNAKIALIKYDDINNLNFLYRKVLQSNGYQVRFNENISDWIVLFDMNPTNYWMNQLDRCPTKRYINKLDNLSILYSNRAYFCAAFSVIYKEINELNKFSKVTTNCFVLPDQKLEFEEVAIALGKNVDWLVKKSKRNQLKDEELNFILNNQQTNRLISEKLWNLNRKTNNKIKRPIKLTKSMYNQMNNLIDNHIISNNYFDKDHFDKDHFDKDHFDQSTTNRSTMNIHNENDIDYLKSLGDSIDNSLKQKNHIHTSSTQNSSHNSISSINVKKRPKSNGHKNLNDFNTDSIQFAIEIIDSLTGKVFRSNHHSNDILQSINFQNFELQKMNNSMVYVQKSNQKSNKLNNTMNRNDKKDLKTNSDHQTIKKSKNKQINKSTANRSNNLNQTDQPVLLSLFTQKGKQFLDQFEQYKSIQKRSTDTMIVEKKIDDLFKINDDTISIRQYVLIKNLNPLRAYIFNEGLVFFMQNTTSFKSKTHWLFSHLRNHLDKQYPSNGLYSNLIEIISKFLLISEFHLITNFKYLERFQFFTHPYDSSYNLKINEQFDGPNEYENNQDDQFRKLNEKLMNEFEDQRTSCDLRQYQLLEIELVMNDRFEFSIVDVNLEPSFLDNQQIPFKEFKKQSKKELLVFQKNLLISVWRLVGFIEPSKLRSNSHLIKQNYVNAKSPKNRRNVRRSITLKKIKNLNLPRKYLDQLSKQSSRVRRKLLFVNESNFKQKLINNFQTNQFRKTLSRLLIEESVGIMGLNCLVSHKLCLNEIDLNNILLSNIELTRKGNNKFDQLYPSFQMCNLNNFIDELSSNTMMSTQIHRTADLHLFLCKLQTQLNNENTVEDQNNSVLDGFKNEPNSVNVTKDEMINIFKNGIPISDQAKQSIRTKSSNGEELKINVSNDYNLLSNDISYSNQIDANNGDSDETIETINFLNSKLESNSSSTGDNHEIKFKRNCSLKDEDLYSIDDLKLEPNLDLKIKFNSKYQAQFETTVNYELIRISLAVNALHCNGRIELDQKMNSASINVSLNLGIGLNRINFRVINNLDHFEQSKIYQINLHRPSLEEITKYDQNNQNQFICQINQNCNFKIYENEQCGLSEIKKVFDNRSIEQQMNSNSNHCTGIEQGRWLIRCNDCNDLFSCDPSSQLWLPYDCTYRKFNQQDLQKCFKNKNLLFIGDSTIRGMMHYLIELTSGTLKSYEKIHNIRIYSDLDFGNLNTNAVFGFAYYPRFWLTNSMPSLGWTVSKLRNMIKLVHKNSIPTSETVIIIGGVHWLSGKHIIKIHDLVQTYKNTRVIFKSLGSGFHQPIQSVHYLPLEKQRRLIDHNQNLINLSKQNNIQILDTFNSSNTMYDAFFVGSCSCHFYKSKLIVKNGYNSYHISGHINEIYSQMLANLICI